MRSTERGRPRLAPLPLCVHGGHAERATPPAVLGTEMATSVPSLQVPTARATGLGEELEQSTSAWCGRRVWVEAGPHVLPSCLPPCHDPEERGREAGCGGRGGAVCGKWLAPVSSAFQKTQIKKMMK